MPTLVEPTVELHVPWLAAHEEWGPGLHEDGFGLGPSDDVGSPDGFRAWVARLTSESTAGTGAPTATYRWIVEAGLVLGGIALRTGPRDHVLRTGHIGFGVRPSARRRGVAAWALGRMLAEATAQGLPRVLLVCEVANTASAATIEALGGVLEDGWHPDVDAMRRYWVTL
jgi:predicted acetyltransferase